MSSIEVRLCALTGLCYVMGGGWPLLICSIFTGTALMCGIVWNAPPWPKK